MTLSTHLFHAATWISIVCLAASFVAEAQAAGSRAAKTQD